MQGLLFCCTKSSPGESPSAPDADLVQESPQRLMVSFPLHQMSGASPPATGENLVQEIPQRLMVSFPLHQASDASPLATGMDLVKKQKVWYSFLKVT